MSAPEPPKIPKTLADCQSDEDFRNFLADRLGRAVVGYLQAHGTHCRQPECEDCPQFSSKEARLERLLSFAEGSAEHHFRAVEDVDYLDYSLRPPNACAEWEFLRDTARGVLQVAIRLWLRLSVERDVFELRAEHPEPGGVPRERHGAHLMRCIRGIAVDFYELFERFSPPDPA